MHRLEIHEPMTVFTDLIIMGLGIWFAKEIHALHIKSSMAVHWQFGKAFWLMAAAGLFGAIAHGVGPHLSDVLNKVIWKFTMLFIGFTSFSLIMGSLYHGFQIETVHLVRWVLITLVIGYVLVVINDDRFINAVRFYIPAMMIMLGVMLYSYFANNSSGTGWVIISVIIAFFGAGIQVGSISLHKHFNHNDIYHVIQMGSMACLYRGVIFLKDFGNY